MEVPEIRLRWAESEMRSGAHSPVGHRGLPPRVHSTACPPGSCCPDGPRLPLARAALSSRSSLVVRVVNPPPAAAGLAHGGCYAGYDAKRATRLPAAVRDHRGPLRPDD